MNIKPFQATENSANNNTPSVIPQLASGEGKVCTDLTPNLKEVEKYFR